MKVVIFLLMKYLSKIEKNCLSLTWALILVCSSTNVFAWSYNGHGAIGILAVENLNIGAKTELKSILGSLDDQTIVEACNWPDAVRETEEWKWSAPQHYVNIPRGLSGYSKPRDCPDQLCATEAIKKYAAQLGDKNASSEQRKQAFAWLCHVTGDIHQPLHAGFADDRGGNNVEIIVDGEPQDLHHYWDRTLIAERVGDGAALVSFLNGLPSVQAPGSWSPVMVDRWTEESHQLAQNYAYPDTVKIDQVYADRSWEIIQLRLSTAISRLAQILNTTL